MYFPLRAQMTSPGFNALPDGIFSHSGITATTETFTASLAIVIIAARMAAAPLISPFIEDIPADGFMEIPPLKIISFKI